MVLMVWVLLYAPSDINKYELFENHLHQYTMVSPEQYTASIGLWVRYNLGDSGLLQTQATLSLQVSLLLCRFRVGHSLVLYNVFYY